MSVYLNSIYTAVPEFRHSQADILELITSYLPDERAKRITKRLFSQSGIDNRYSVIEYFGDTGSTNLFAIDSEGTLHEPGTGARNQCYTQEADKLARSAVRGLMDEADGFSPADITHVVTVSCTGFYNPGMDFSIIDELGLMPSVERYHIGFMGCYAAFPAMRMARQFCKANPDSVVLVLCLELCTLHLQFGGGADSLLANTLFADGAAAAIISKRQPLTEKNALELGPFHSGVAPEGRNSMAWNIGDSGFNMVLSSYVPEVISMNIESFLGDLLACDCSNLSDIQTWAIHPGGRSILDKVQSGLSLTDDQMLASREVLQNYGNMSSATILFVLKRIMESIEIPERMCALAFGPGLTIESCLINAIPASIPPVACTQV